MDSSECPRRHLKPDEVARKARKEVPSSTKKRRLGVTWHSVQSW